MAANKGWVEVQSETFVKWVNSELSQVKGFDVRVENLTTDFKTGVTLIELITKVVGKPFGLKVIRTPKFKMHEMENLNAAFKFLAANDVKLVNIGPEDVYDGKLKLILGLLWTLISNFSIIHRLRGDPDNKMGAKQLLLQWVNSKVSPTFVQNFKADWRDGQVLARLTNVLGREIYGDEAELVPQSLVDGNDPDALVTAAIAAAEKKLSVAPLLDTPTFRDDTCDEHSMMTYVAIFCDAHKPDPPALDPAAQSLLDWVNSKVNPDKRAENFDADWHDGTVLAALANVIGKEVHGEGEEVVPLALAQGGDPEKLVAATLVAAADRLCIAQSVEVTDITRADGGGAALQPYVEQYKSPQKPAEPVAAAPPAGGEGTENGGSSAVVEEAESLVSGGDEATSATTSSAPPASTADRVSPLKRAPDWRTYEGIDLGGRCRIRVYYSTTTHSKLVRKNTEALQTLFEALKVHEREDFEPWIPLDMDMDKAFRDKIFEKAGTRESPMVFVDDEYIGNYPDITELHSTGELTRILNY